MDVVTAPPLAEKSVIGAGLINVSTLRAVADRLEPGDFLDPRLGKAYELMQAARVKREPVDEQIIAAAMKNAGYQIDPLLLFDCREATPSAGSVTHYAQIVADAAGKRRLTDFAERSLALSKSSSALPEVMTNVRALWEQLGVKSGRPIDAPLLRDVLDGPDDYDWIIPNLLERRDRLVVTGGEGAGKSFFVQQLAICAAAGIHPTTFEPITPVRVLVVDAENSEKQWRRRVRPLVIQATREGQLNPADSLRLACVPRLNITSERDLASVHNLIEEHLPDILVIGPLYRLLPRAIQSDDDAAPLINALDSLRARGPALVMEAHAGHAKDGAGERDLRPRGSSALMGWPEFGLGLRLVDQGDDVVRAAMVRWRGDRDQRAWPYVLRRGGRWPWTDDDPEMTRRHYQTKYAYQ